MRTQGGFTFHVSRFTFHVSRFTKAGCFLCCESLIAGAKPMQNRASFMMAAAVVVPLVAVLLVVLGLAGPASNPAADPGANGATGAPQPPPRASGPPAPELAGGGAWLNSEP